MEFTGVFKGIGKELDTGRYIVDLRLNEDVTKAFHSLKDTEVSVRITKHRHKRSLDANSYYWVLVTKIAEVLKASKPFVHNMLLRKYGQIEMFDSRGVYIVIPDTEESTKKADEAEFYHLKPTSQVKLGKDGIMYRTYMMLRGSSDYDTKEMSELIDGTVSEAKQMGIETFPPHEIERMKREWGIEA